MTKNLVPQEFKDLYERLHVQAVSLYHTEGVGANLSIEPIDGFTCTVLDAYNRIQEELYRIGYLTDRLTYSQYNLEYSLCCMIGHALDLKRWCEDEK